MLVSERAEKLFIEAQALDPDTRVDFVNEACEGDAELLEEVNSLLTAANQSEAYFDDLSGKVSIAALAEDAGPLPENTLVGPWRLVELIGNGGMGSVYLAERADGQFEQLAALKILPIGMNSQQARNRFLAERQILARLVHDNIARLLDGGVTEDGVPYFAMDYVDGVPIDAYCKEHSLSIKDRLQLVLSVTEAVQYAHQNLVVHRDLKPGNVLVEDGGRVRLLDFGIAKVLEPGSAEQSLTQVTQRPATPAYSSPEMLRGEPVDITTDVYSIGVLLYQLLTGRLPIDLDGLSLAAMHERSANFTPPPPSRFNDRISRDLDAVIGKALAKLPKERYASVEGLATDLRRYLDDVPVNARVPSTAYRARKFMVRHWRTTASVAFVVTALAGIAAMAVHSAIESERQAEAIALERDRAEEIRDFLKSTFASADPHESASDLTTRQILDNGRRRIREELAGQPKLQAELAFTIGDVYAMLMMTEEWRDMLELERELTREGWGTESAEYVDVLIGFSQLEDMDGNYDASQEYAAQSLAIAEQLGDPLVESQAQERMGRILHLKGDYDSADMHYRRGLELREAELGARHPETNAMRMHLATLLNHQQLYEEALALVESVLEIRLENFPGDHDKYTEVFLTKGSALTDLGRYDEARVAYQQAFDMNVRLFGEDNPRNLYVVNGLGTVAEKEGNYPLAAENYAEAMRLTAMHFPDHPNLAIATSNLAKVYTFDGAFSQAIPLYRDAIDIIERNMPDHWMLGDMRWRLGQSILKTGGDFEEAEQLILAGVDTLKAQWGDDHQTTRNAMAAAEELYAAQP